MYGKLDVRNGRYTFGGTDMKGFLAILFLLGASSVSSADLTVFAAASTTDVMKALAAKFKENGGENIRFNFASSGALARQIDAGAPADLYVSANVRWMNYLEEKDLLLAGTRTNIACNALVLVAPKNSVMTFEGFPSNLKRMLAVGEFRSVPAGTYAEAALKSLGWLDDVEGKLVKGTNVRTVLMYVERGEVDAGIVYRTDAMQSAKVKVIGTFPEDSYPPIVYPVACLKTGSASAKTFMEFLKSETAKAVFKQYGFINPSDTSD